MTVTERTRWLGHLERLPTHRAVKNAHIGYSSGQQPVARSKYRRMDQAKKDLRTLHAEN